MKTFTALIIVGPLLLSGALPAVAGKFVASNTGVQLVAASDAAADRDTYTQKVRDEMRVWEQKLHDFSAKTEADGKEAGNAAEKDLDIAWKKAKIESGNLQTASAEGWASAKVSFENASRELADVWDKIRPEDK